MNYIHKAFIKVTEKEAQSTFKYDETPFYTNAMLPVSHYALAVPHLGHSIQLNYEQGNLNLAHVWCELNDSERVPEFKITHRSHLWRLFNKKNTILRVTSSNKQFEAFLYKTLNQTGLEAIARDTVFEPEIGIEYQNNITVIKGQFHLSFNDKDLVIHPLIKLFKAILDYKITHL